MVITHFDSFGVKHIPKENKRFIGNNRMQAKFNNVQILLYCIC